MTTAQVSTGPDGKITIPAAAFSSVVNRSSNLGTAPLYNDTLKLRVCMGNIIT